MTARHSHQRAAAGTQDHNEKTRPASRKGEGDRSANKAGDAAVNRPKPGKARHKKDGKDD